MTYTRDYKAFEPLFVLIKDTSKFDTYLEREIKKNVISYKNLQKNLTVIFKF